MTSTISKKNSRERAKWTKRLQQLPRREKIWKLRINSKLSDLAKVSQIPRAEKAQIPKPEKVVAETMTKAAEVEEEAAVVPEMVLAVVVVEAEVDRELEKQRHLGEVLRQKAPIRHLMAAKDL